MKVKVNDKERFKRRKGMGGLVNTPTVIEIKPEKIRYDFVVPAEKKDIFSNWINILSQPEFLVTVHNIKCTKYSKSKRCFYITISGQQEDLDRWHSNLKVIVRFLNNEYNKKIKYGETKCQLV